jgi:hypothetical protein
MATSLLGREPGSSECLPLEDVTMQLSGDHYCIHYSVRDSDL